MNDDRDILNHYDIYGSSPVVTTVIKNKYEPMAEHMAENMIREEPKYSSVKNDKYANVVKLTEDIKTLFTYLDSADPQSYQEMAEGKAGEVIMGEENDRIGENNQSKVRVPLRATKSERQNESNTRLLTMHDVISGLDGIECMRSISLKPFSVSIGGFSQLKISDLIATDDKDIFLIESSKLERRSASDCIFIDREDTLGSFIALNSILKKQLCHSAEFMNYVKNGVLEKTTLAERNQFNKDLQNAFEQQKIDEEQRALANGTLMETEKILEYAIKEVQHLNCMEIFYAAVMDLETAKGDEATSQEKMRICSEIIHVAQDAFRERHNSQLVINEKCEERITLVTR